MTRDQVYGAMFGVAIGDALGVPAEFKSRTILRSKPIKGFIGYGSHNQPPGTFSDDTSLTFCLAASLCNGYNLYDIGNRFVDWYHKGYWTAGGNVFDIGMTTSNAIARLRKGTETSFAGDFDEDSNGNGSLMRILPLLFHIKEMPIEQRFEHVKAVSSITHGHIRSVLACFFYLECALALLQGQSKQSAYLQAGQLLRQIMNDQQIVQPEIDLFAPLTDGNIAATPIENIGSSGYVMNTLKASMHCFLTTDNYQDAVLKAVNLGDDADTTAAVAGGLAGLHYGHAAIPEKWRTDIRRAGDITDLCELMFVSFS
ncbi:ADP-ribosylglycohydrolase family protein [Paraflavitalea pollutisoli]|uniref:ADP-ribosylglycohydrolase family protein n=1 Tax=Paraflavitalea pollutisoli TaxID=3034143 RepID=UPI0023EBE48B|nr:ADP-ribosylglycohydrolase family protein [Paraflavitalea sp. H1-2-19X]